MSWHSFPYVPSLHSKFNNKILYYTVGFCLLVSFVFMHEFTGFQSEIKHYIYLILSNLKIVDNFILCSPSSKQILKSLRQYSYFYFDYANVLLHIFPWLFPWLFFLLFKICMKWYHWRLNSVFFYISKALGFVYTHKKTRFIISKLPLLNG